MTLVQKSPAIAGPDLLFLHHLHIHMRWILWAEIYLVGCYFPLAAVELVVVAAVPALFPLPLVCPL